MEFSTKNQSPICSNRLEKSRLAHPLRMSHANLPFVWGTMLLLCIGFSAWADTPALGRLFFSEQERRELNRLREEKQSPEKPIAEKKQTPLPTKSFTVNGIVARSNGNNTYWINGQPVPENALSHPGIHIIKHSNGGPIKVEFPCGSRNVQLKPGQKVICPGVNRTDAH
uniref:Uncharacterized protein n=1 Tax=Candidatus Kentrum sp. MB TaxID=2138164 RepID=A0A450XMC4_9GAMM|nr:MAG: hypothetical protein BECKMB1821G_GA0114241_106217 [Candidatus Kentron sp. MB]